MADYFSETGLLNLLYTAASTLLAGALFYRWLQNDLKLGLKSSTSLFLLFFAELLWIIAIPGYSGFLFFSIACLALYNSLPHCRMLPVEGKAVLITGCDSGFGYELVKHLDAQGFTVFAGFLNESGTGASELKKCCSNNLHVLQMDITSSEQIEKAYQYVKSKLNAKGLWGIVSNAGILHCLCDGELLPMSTYRQAMEVNFFGGVEVLKVFCPLLRKSKGRYITVISLTVHVPFRGYAAYSASKAAMYTYAETMRLELSKWGIKVAAIVPGGFKTNIFASDEEWNRQIKKITENVRPDVVGEYGQDYIFNWKDIMDSSMTTCSSDLSLVVNDIHHALLAEKPSHEYFPGKGTVIFPFIYHYCPRWFFSVFMDSVLSKGQLLPSANRKY